MDQDTARMLFHRFGTLLLLDAPEALEFGLDYIERDELMEVTPLNIRLRKANLDFKRSV